MTPRETVPLGYAAAILRYPTCPLVDDGDRCFLELTREQHDRLRDLSQPACLCEETPCWCGMPDN